MNTNVYLIRHGEVQYRYNEEGKQLIYGADAILSEEGRNQIIDLCEQLKRDEVNLDILCSSPLIRTRQTVEIIKEELGNLDIISVPDLRDISAPGWAGRTMEELMNNQGNVYDSQPASSDQETMSQLQERMFRAITDIIEENRGRTIGIVSHGDGIRVYIERLINPAGLPKVDRDENYLAKGEVWKLIFDENNGLIDREKYSIKECGNHVERKLY